MIRQLARTAAALSLLCLAATTAQAQHQRVTSGVTAAGVPWQAQSLLVGVTSTAAIAAFGDPIYQPSLPISAGMVSLTINFGGPPSICTGTLMPDRQSVLTAAHCVTDGNLGLPISTTAAFYGGTAGDTIVYQSVFASRVNVAQYNVHPSYTGDVFDQNDVAVLRLSAPAPEFAPSFGLYTQDLTGSDFTVWGYGARSEFGGNVGANLNVGRLRQGDNRFDFRLGDSVFGNHWATEFAEPLAQIEHSWLSDFDNGLAANDAGCRALAVGLPAVGTSSQWCDLGRGAREVGLAGGDSGGPSFINGLVAAISSFGVTYGTAAYGDVDTRLNSSFGEFSGYVPMYLHADFINAALVPEPASWLAMALGLLAVLVFVRRRPTGPTAKRSRSKLAAAATAAAGFFAPLGQAHAATPVYTDPAAFLAALQPGAYTESFNSGVVTFQPSFSFAGAGFAYRIEGGAASGAYTDGDFIGNLVANRSLVISFTAGTPLAVGGRFFVVDAGDVVVPNASVSLMLSNGFSTAFSVGSGNEYRGFVSDVPISALVISAPGAGNFNALDQLTVGVVPEPGSGSMLALGTLGMLGWMARRRGVARQH
jgi:hypothetical protein